MSVYLLHFSRPYVGVRRNPQARRTQIVSHYLGYTPRDVEQRIEQHRQGQGARLTQVVVAAGIELFTARIWKSGTRTDERRLKNWKKARDLCPLCRKGVQP